MNTPDPTEYLRARYAEDEAAARAAIFDAASGVWRTRTDIAGDECMVDGDDITIYDEGGHTQEQAAHIARHDPARVLADVAAKRAVLNKCSPHLPPPGCPADPWSLSTNLAVAVVRDLLQPYVDREDFPDEWRTT